VFSVLFAVYAIISSGVSLSSINHDFFNLPIVFFETFLLLLSSLSCGMMIVEMHQKNINLFFIYFLITFLLGFVFISMELIEFYHLIKNNFRPSTHAFCSAFFTLVGTHGLHVFCGLIWMLSIFYQIIKLGITETIRIRILCFSLFWHFLDIIWICVFTFVYLYGAI
ncbi:cytochrome c oxidase subunit 3, partial [Buchnera aphidicola]|nr:cytochrome c oxidase subunit 3 [Buchnera aphidicola]